MPALLRVSGLWPRCWQQGALKDVQPLGLDLARAGNNERNLSTTRVIDLVYYLYNTLSRVPGTDKLPSITNVLAPLYEDPVHVIV